MFRNGGSMDANAGRRDSRSAGSVERRAERRHLPLNAGEWVEVRSKAEILATLDERGRCDGMPFMPEMLRYCGKRLLVGKRAHKTCDTVSNTWLRRVDDAVHLDEVRCDGQSHGGCDAGCMIFWKEAWLKRLGSSPQPSAADVNARSGCSEDELKRATRAEGSPEHGDDLVYACQATQLLAASSPIRAWDLRHFIEDYRSLNVGVGAFARGLGYRLSSFLIIHTNTLGRKLGMQRELATPFIAVYDAVQSLLPSGVPFPRRRGAVPKGQRTPAGPPKQLQPGDWVRVKSHREILSTLDQQSRNRGLYFDAEHVPYCDKVQRVHSLVRQIVDERTGKLLRFKAPCVILEGAYCQGAYSERRMFCPRAIYPYWRDLWLERVDPPAPAADAAEAVAVSESC
jgi:hypothetical protein